MDFNLVAPPFRELEPPNSPAFAPDETGLAYFIDYYLTTGILAFNFEFISLYLLSFVGTLVTVLTGSDFPFNINKLSFPVFDPKFFVDFNTGFMLFVETG